MSLYIHHEFWKKIRTGSRLILLCWSVSVLGLTACERKESTVPVTPNTKQGLRQVIEALLATAQVQQETKLIEQVNEVLPTGGEVEKLLRVNELNKGLGQHYEQNMRQSAQAEWPWALQELVKKGYTEISITRVSPLSGADNAPGDLALLEQLKNRDGLYTVRIHPKDSEKGLRINSWVYVNKKWITLLKLGEVIEDRGSKVDL